jgi:hypothetical protein
MVDLVLIQQVIKWILVKNITLKIQMECYKNKKELNSTPSVFIIFFIFDTI